MSISLTCRAFAASLAIAAAVASAGVAFGQTPAQRIAYDYTLRCWAVAGYLITDPDVQRDQQASAQAEVSARRAFDAAHRMGGALGYSHAQITGDLDRWTRIEGALMLRNRAYFERTKADCQQLGLI